MSQERKPQEETPAPDAIARWVRQRREELGLTVGQVASALGVTPAFVSMIESGRKRPGVEVAAKLARTLKENEGLLLSWIQTYRPRSLEAARRTAREIEEFLAREQGQEWSAEPSITSATPAAGAGRMPAAASPPPAALAWNEGLLQVPVVAEGADPDDAGAALDAVAEPLLLDPKMLPAGESLDRPFAYRLGEAGASRARDVLRAGDVVVISRQCWPTVKDEIYAVRLDQGIVLTRVLDRGDTMLLVSSDTSSAGFELLPVKDSTRAPDQLRGRVVIAIRRWR